MEYIVNIKRYLNEEDKGLLNNNGMKIIYESQFLKIIGVETNNVERLEELKFVNNVRSPLLGEFQDGQFHSNICFEPPVKRSLLSSRGLVGWGDTRVAILDSGVNNEVSVTDKKDFTNTGIADRLGHGNDVAKIFKFLAKGASLYIGKVGESNPNELLVMQGLEWAYNQGAMIINLSVGFKRPCKGKCDLCNLVNMLSDQGVAIVIAAGNNDNIENSIECPGHAIKGITVGAVGSERKITDYSSFGKVNQAKPNIVAPGNVHVDGRYITGTSFAAPFVSGVLGAILRKSGSVNNAIEYIYKSVDDLGYYSHQQGLGYLNIKNLVEVLDSEENDIESSGQNKSS